MTQHRGFDFTGYKRSSLTRRVNRRMAQVGAGDYAEYLDYLEMHTEEFTALFNTILINVTSFFRDPEAWEYLRTEILPKILAAKAPDGVLRVWSAGCASGKRRTH
jgi:two-component system CheB/CheR fusion protein